MIKLFFLARSVRQFSSINITEVYFHLSAVLLEFETNNAERSFFEFYVFLFSKLLLIKLFSLNCFYFYFIEAIFAEIILMKQ